MSDTAMQLMPSPAAPPPDQMPAIIPIKFWPVYKPDLDGKIVQEDWVEWVKKGEAGGGAGGATTAEAVKRLMPTQTRQAAIEWAVIGPAYQAWKAGEAMPESGTPLASWSGVPREMADALKKFNIFTVEDLADFPDHNIGKVPLPNLRDWRNRARAFKEAESTSNMGAELAKRDRQIEAQADMMQEMRDRMAELEKIATAAKVVSGGVAPVSDAPPHDPDDDMMPVGENLVPASPPAPRQSMQFTPEQQYMPQQSLGDPAPAPKRGPGRQPKNS